MQSKQDSETKEKLLKSAKSEFLSLGYRDASLRSICKNAGVTTGALYFFFNDKETLFGTIVKEPLEQIIALMQEHFTAERQYAKDKIAYSENDDLESAKKILHFLYQHYDESILLISKSQGSSYEHCIDRIIAIMEEHYILLANELCKEKNIKSIGKSIIHWVSHSQIDSFIYLLTHVESEKKALSLLPTIINYLVSGWESMFC